MPRIRCKSCRGEYDAISRDGVPYAHACAPAIMVTTELDDGSRLTQPLTSFAGLELVADQGAKERRVREGKRAGELAIELARDVVERRNRRDENPDLTRPAINGQRPITAEGDGVEPL